MALGGTRYKLAYGLLAVIILAMIGYLAWKGVPAQAPGMGETATTTLPSQVVLTQTYASSTLGFSIRYPEGYILDPHFVFGFGMGEEGGTGIALNVPTSTRQGTNLSSDAQINVLTIPKREKCDPVSILAEPSGPTQKISDNNTDYLIATSSGAAAGNRYEETAYVVLGTNPCIAVRYFIHYGVIDNYPPGTVKEFDKAALLKQFDAIRRTLVIGQ